MEFLDNKSYFDGDKPLIIPHRGGSNIVPENTLHGLELAIKEEFSHFETDLRMSKDGEIFLHHDETFDRTTNVSGKVQDFNWSEISKINAGYKFYDYLYLQTKVVYLVGLEHSFAIKYLFYFWIKVFFLVQMCKCSQLLIIFCPRIDLKNYAEDQSHLMASICFSIQ